MTEIRRREGDRDDLDVRSLRHVNPAAWDLQLGWGDKKLSVRGLAIIAVLAVGVIVGTTLYTAVQADRGHHELSRGQDQTSCILTMSQEERTKFRQDVGPNSFERWCWWVRAQR